MIIIFLTVVRIVVGICVKMVIVSNNNKANKLLHFVLEKNQNNDVFAITLLLYSMPFM